MFEFVTKENPFIFRVHINRAYAIIIAMTTYSTCSEPD